MGALVIPSEDEEGGSSEEEVSGSENVSDQGESDESEER